MFDYITFLPDLVRDIISPTLFVLDRVMFGPRRMTQLL